MPLPRPSLFALLAVLAATTAPAQARILPLGDSITESVSGFAGYRYFLWKDLSAVGACVDFVGNRSGVANGAPLFQDFDQDHAGYSGLTAQTIAMLMKCFPSSVPASDIALVHLGTNDILLPLLAGLTPDLDAAFDAMVDVVGALRQRRPSVRIAIAQILPIDPSSPLAPMAHTYVPRWNRKYLPKLLELSTPASPIVLVDQNTAFDVRDHLRDGVHPNDVGAAKFAANWFAALSDEGWLPPGTACVATLAPGCADATGHALPPRLEAGLPRVGFPFTLQMTNAPSSTTIAALVVGASESAPPIEWNGCPIHPSADLVFVRLAGHAPVSSASFTLQLPPSTPRGLQFYVQAVTCGPVSNEQTTSNGLQLIAY